MAAPESAPTPEASEGEVAPNGIKSKIPMIAMVAVGLAVGAGSGAAFIGPMVAKKLGKAPATHAQSSADSAAGKGGAGKESAAKEGAGKEGEKGGSGSESSVVTLENLVLNPANSNGQRFLLLSVAIETGTPTATTEMKARDAELRDVILTALGTKSVEQLTDVTAKESIKREVQAAISNRFGKTSVKRLFFPQFVVQ